MKLVTLGNLLVRVVVSEMQFMMQCWALVLVYFLVCCYTALDCAPQIGIKISISNLNQSPHQLLRQIR